MTCSAVFASSEENRHEISHKVWNGHGRRRAADPGRLRRRERGFLGGTDRHHGNNIFGGRYHRSDDAVGMAGWAGGIWPVHPYSDLSARKLIYPSGSCIGVISVIQTGE